MLTFDYYEDFVDFDYPNLREVLADEYKYLPRRKFERLFENYYLSAEDIEGVFDTLKNAGKVFANAAPEIGQTTGIVAGTMYLGGPQGGMIGADIGKRAGTAVKKSTGSRSQSKTSTPPDVQATVHGVTTNLQAQQASKTPEPLLGASPAAYKLINVLSRPEWWEALQKWMVRQFTEAKVTVGNKDIPLKDFAKLLEELAKQLQKEQQVANPSIQENIPEYLYDYTGKLIGEPVVRDYSPEVLYELLMESDIELIPYDDAEAEEEAFYTELELAEYYDYEDM